MNLSEIGYLIVNFGGPRSLKEVRPFLKALLTDRDVIRSKLPFFLHDFVFSRVAKKRAERIAKDYQLIGGKSPIFEDTEEVAKLLSEDLKAPVLTFHRYLPDTHADSLTKIEQLDVKEVRVFPMFPQFCFATTGSIARFFDWHLSKKVIEKVRWIKSYSDHPAYLSAFKEAIDLFLKEKNLQEEEVAFLFSAHGVPKSFIQSGDPYEKECLNSYMGMTSLFPKAISKLAFQSQFGKGEWLSPSTLEACHAYPYWCDGRKKVIIIPLTFTSDHLETLYEIEEQYLPPLRDQGLEAFRCPALNRNPLWIKAISQIFRDSPLENNSSLIRK